MIDGMTYRERATSIIDAVLWRSVIEPAQERTRIMPDGCAVPIPVQPIGVEPRFRPIQRQRPVRSARSPRTGEGDQFRRLRVDGCSYFVQMPSASVAERLSNIGAQAGVDLAPVLGDA